MKFRTTCCHCASVFRLTAEQLDAVQGWAQCGVCGAAFDTRPTLAAENGDPLPLESAPSVIEEVVNTLPSSTSAAEIPGENAAAPAPQIPDPADTAPPPGSHSVPHLPGIENRTGNPDLSSIILIDPDAEVPDDYGPLPRFPALRPPTSETLATASGHSVYGPNFHATPTSAQTVFLTDPQTQPQKVVWHEAPTRRRFSGVIWTLPILVLGLGLLLQSAYFLRDTLASKAPATRPWLEAACARIGCSLSLPQDAALIQIIGSDLQAEPAGQGHLQLKLTLGNRAAYTQAWPVIVLTLIDAKDQAQARRSFAPSEYLSDPKLLALGIPAQSEHPLSLPLEVRNLTMAGYRLELGY